MKILGLSSNYHDASAALVCDGKIVASSAEERFTLNKHDPNLPRHAIDFCLRSGGIDKHQLDLVVYHEEPLVKLSRALSSSLMRFPWSANVFSRSMRDAMKHGFWIKNEISQHLDIHPAKIVFVPHHASHAAYSFLTSGFEEAAVLTVDAVGEWTSSAIFKASRKNDRLKIDPVEVYPFPQSIGLVYSAFTAFLGFKVNDGECSTMALAAFGKPSYVDQVKQVIEPLPNGSYRVNVDFLDLSGGSGLPVAKKFFDLFGSARPFNTKLEFSSFDDLKLKTEISIDQKRWADIACSLQTVTEECLLGMTQRCRNLMPDLENICLAGGVALNCVANAKIASSGVFENIFVPPDPGDGGASLGAALYSSATIAGTKGLGIDFSPYLGEQHDEAPAVEMLKEFSAKENIVLQTFKNRDDLISAVAEEIYQGGIVGWMQGRFEHGPRALGNRSILADPSRLDVAKRLSKEVKQRASFRPYACSMTAEAASLALQGGWPRKSSSLFRWMLAAEKVNPIYTSKLAAALHVDTTTRVQVCDAAENPSFFALLKEFEKKSGFAALLNTSFNESGMPLVNTCEEALLLFMRTEMDLLAMGNTLVRKGRKNETP